MDSYVSKPLEPAELFDTVESLALYGRDHPQEAFTPTGVAADGSAPCPLPPAAQASASSLDFRPDFDRVQAVGQAGGDEELLKELMVAFLSEYPPLLSQISEAIAQRDSRRLQDAAHKLKGAAASLAALRTSDAAQQLENMSRNGNLSGASTACAELEEALRRLRPALLVNIRNLQIQ